VSVALQAALRRWLPYLAFGGAEAFAAKRRAYPMLVYQASRPFLKRGEPEFAYDPMSAASINLALRSSGKDLGTVLRHTRRWLEAAGEGGLAAGAYAEKLGPAVLREVQKSNVPLAGLLALDGFVVDQFARLGRRARELKPEAERETGSGQRCLFRFLDEFARKLSGQLRRAYKGVDGAGLGGMLVVEAAAAVSGLAGQRVPVKAAMRIGNAERPEEGELVATCRRMR
jgi:hypothetical protein